MREERGIGLDESVRIAGHIGQDTFPTREEWLSILANDDITGPAPSSTLKYDPQSEVVKQFGQAKCAALLHRFEDAVIAVFEGKHENIITRHLREDGTTP